MEKGQEAYSSEQRKLQAAETELVSLFADVCKKEGLTYFMLGGTLLGAVRHKGFIPWDDDLDIALPRPDYEVFLSTAEKYLPEGYHLLNPRTTKGYLYYIPSLTCSKTKVKKSLYQKETVEDVSIDIFPLDGMPSSKLMQDIHEFRTLVYRALYKFSVFDQYVAVKNEHRTWYEKFLIALCGRFKLQRLFSPEKRLRKYDKVIQRYSYENSDYIMNFMGAYKLKEMLPKKVFGEGKLYDFEGLKLSGPQDYDAYLTRLYGDYMTPVREADYSKHGFEVLTDQK